MKFVRKIHKYFAIFLGLALLMWILTGILMALPVPTLDAVKAQKRPVLDLAGVTLSPAALSARVRERHGPAAEITGLSLRHLLGRLVYQASVRKRPDSLHDAETGEPIEITPAMAESLVRERLKEDLGQARVERLDRHTTTYPWGPLPVYRIGFSEGGSLIGYVAQENGAVSFTNRRQQIRSFVTSLHDFAPLRFLLSGHNVRSRILVLTAALCLVIVGTGYYMALSRRARPSRKRKADG